MLQTIPFGRVDLDCQAFWPQKILAVKDDAALAELKAEAQKTMDRLANEANQTKEYPRPNLGMGIYA